MALKIIIPDDLHEATNTYLIAALQDCGAQPISGNEWRYEGKVLTPSKFIPLVKDKLLEGKKEDAHRLIVTPLRGDDIMRSKQSDPPEG